MIPYAECEQRIKLLQKHLGEQTLDGALFVYPADIDYFAGTRQDGALWIPAQGVAMYLVRKSYSRARNESIILDIRPFPSSSEFPSFFDNGIRKIGLTLDVMPVQYYQYYAGLLPGVDFIDISTVIRKLRSVKSLWEQERMRESCRRLVSIFSQIPSFLERGMREIDLAAEMESRIRREGSEGAIRIRSFGKELIGIASAGECAAYPGAFDGPVTGKGISSSAPYGASASTIEENVPIIVDYSGTFGGYMSDMTRIFVFGDLDPALKTAHIVALEIEAWVAMNLRTGKICEDIYLGSLDMADKAGFGENFMGIPGEQAKFVGHGVGLELDELPVLAKGFSSKLEEGQVVAVEPKFIFPGKGVVGIENTFLVTSSGGENLTILSNDIVYL